MSATNLAYLEIIWWPKILVQCQKNMNTLTLGQTTYFMRDKFDSFTFYGEKKFVFNCFLISIYKFDNNFK